MNFTASGSTGVNVTAVEMQQELFEGNLTVNDVQTIEYGYIYVSSYEFSSPDVSRQGYANLFSHYSSFANSSQASTTIQTALFKGFSCFLYKYANQSANVSLFPNSVSLSAGYRGSFPFITTVLPVSMVNFSALMQEEIEAML